MLIGHKILLVEDDQFIRELYEMFLKEEGFEVISAAAGNDALAKFKSEYFDLVLLDILLPEVDGIELLSRFRKLNEKVPVAMLTNLAQENLIKKAFDLGAVGYLLKARITRKDLIKEVKGFIEAPSQVPNKV